MHIEIILKDFSIEDFPSLSFMPNLSSLLFLSSLLTNDIDLVNVVISTVSDKFVLFRIILNSCYIFCCYRLTCDCRQKRIFCYLCYMLIYVVYNLNLVYK